MPAPMSVNYTDDSDLRHYTAVDFDPDPGDRYGQDGTSPEQRRGFKGMIEKTMSKRSSAI